MLIEKVIKDLKGFRDFLKSRGYDVVEGPHAVLTDSSEVCSWEIVRNGNTVAQLVAHYVDHHYLATATLPEQAEDSDIIKALVESELGGKFIVPVEPVIISSSDGEFLELVKGYRDEFSCEEAEKAFKHYISNPAKVGSVKEMLLRMV